MSRSYVVGDSCPSLPRNESVFLQNVECRLWSPGTMDMIIINLI